MGGRREKLEPISRLRDVMKRLTRMVLVRKGRRRENPLFNCTVGGVVGGEKNLNGW